MRSRVDATLLLIPFFACSSFCFLPASHSVSCLLFIPFLALCPYLSIPTTL